MSKIEFPKVNLTNVKGVIIDIDNTLYNYNDGHNKAIKSCYNHFVDAFDTRLTFQEFHARYRQKRNEVVLRLKPTGPCRSRLFAFQSLFEEMRVPHSYNYALEFEALYWDSLIENIIGFNDAYTFLEECRNLSIPVCALSDMQAHFQITKIQALHMEKLINFLVTSEEIGCEKPNTLMFKAALKKLDVTANDAIMIGDHPTKDIVGAKKLGIQAYKVEIYNDS